MARGKYVSDFERDVMRIGHANGQSAETIALFLNRTVVCVYQHLAKMRRAGTLENLPFAVISERIADELGATNGQE